MTSRLDTHVEANRRFAHQDGHELDARKTVHAFDFILKSFGMDVPWCSSQRQADYVHDLAVMLRHGDLGRASLELLGADRSVLYRHRVEFGAAHQGPAVDAARGVELPLLDRAKIADSRITVGPTRQIDSYRSQLRCNWDAADKLRDRPGCSFDSDHTRRINAGKVKGTVFVSDEARLRLSVLNVSADGSYAFARSAALPSDVFLHRKQCDQPLTFEPGQQIACTVVQTPRGIQGRNIRPAAQYHNT